MSQTIKPGQKLSETWEIEYECVTGTGISEVRGRLTAWPNTTYYAASATGATVDEVRLKIVLGLARGVCDDETAFQHDARDIHLADMRQWFLGKQQEIKEQIETEKADKDSEDYDAVEIRELLEKLATIRALFGEWGEDHDYYPEAGLA